MEEHATLLSGSLRRTHNVNYWTEFGKGARDCVQA